MKRMGNPNTDDPNPSCSLFQECWAHVWPICCHSEPCTSCFLPGRFWASCAAADKSLCVFDWALTRRLHILWRTLSLSQLQFLQRPAFSQNFHFYSPEVWESNFGFSFRSQQPEITFKLRAFKPDSSLIKVLPVLIITSRCLVRVWMFYRPGSAQGSFNWVSCSYIGHMMFVSVCSIQSKCFV